MESVIGKTLFPIGNNTFVELELGGLFWSLCGTVVLCLL